MTITELARQANLRPSAIRYYEQIGVLPRAARTGGRRRYGRATAERLVIIRFARAAGFTLKEVRVLFSGFPESAPASTRWEKLARRKLAEVEQLLASVQQAKDLLEKLLRCRCDSLAECAANCLAPPRRIGRKGLDFGAASR